MVMGTGAWFLGLAATPCALSSAFVVPGGFRSSTFSPATAGGFVVAPVAAAAPMVGSVPSVSMGSEDPSCSSSLSSSPSTSRGKFVEQMSAGVVVAAAVAGGGWVAPAAADSTGKYSSKATAKKRYLPRIVKLVSSFQLLKNDIASGSASPKSEFFSELLPDSISAMDLYGSSMKKGETPDSKSRALQQLAQDFESQCISIGKSLGKKGGEADATKSYEKASEILVQYLKGVELDPLGSDAYK